MRTPDLFRIACRIGAWVCVLALAYFSLVPPNLKAETGAPGQLNHAFGYFVTGIALRWAYPQAHPVLIVVLLALYGFVLEGLQNFVPGRDAKLIDALSSGGGGGIRVLLGVVLLGLAPLIGGAWSRPAGDR